MNSFCLGFLQFLWFLAVVDFLVVVVVFCILLRRTKDLPSFFLNNLKDDDVAY